MIISICGKSGSGKSYVANLLTSYNSNIVLLKIDEIGHNSLKNEEVKLNLISTFGSFIIEKNEIDRKKLGNLVFNNKYNMKLLEKITWNLMEKEIDFFINENKNKIIILDYFYLPFTKYFDISKIKILVDAPYELRLLRAKNRDNITEEQFKLRESASMNYNKKIFDYVINNYNIDKTERMVRKIYDKSIVSR